MVPATVGHQCPECVREGRKLQPKVKLASSTPYATYAIIGICVVMAVLTQGGGSFETSYRFGARYAPAIAAGDWWRLITPIFLHGGIFHIGFNMFAVYTYGPGLERAFGIARFIALFLAAGFLGNALGFFAGDIGRLSVGASGAVFGVFGAWAVYFYRRRRSDARAEQMLRGLGGLIAINLLFGFVVNFVDNWAHIGGLIGGAIIGFALDQGSTRRAKGQSVLIAAAGVAVVLAVGTGLVLAKLNDVPKCRIDFSRPDPVPVCER